MMPEKYFPNFDIGISEFLDIENWDRNNHAISLRF
tara:strand:- start:368 stop:472 length:105 start_codon:yes stop_codon:yes gene_type:complete